MLKFISAGGAVTIPVVAIPPLGDFGAFGLIPFHHPRKVIALGAGMEAAQKINFGHDASGVMHITIERGKV